MTLWRSEIKLFTIFKKCIPTRIWRKLNITRIIKNIMAAKANPKGSQAFAGTEIPTMPPSNNPVETIPK